MGYFSGTEGRAYEEAYCDRCVHQKGPDGQGGCAVWLAHLLYNSEKSSVLHVLIPRSQDGLSNERCQMLWPPPDDLDIPAQFRRDAGK